MRFILANLIYDEPVTFQNIHSLIPEIYSFNEKEMSNLRRPRIIKSHECFVPEYPKVIYLVRDPRAVAVSYYYYHLKHMKINKNYSMAQFVEKFITGNLDNFGTWADNIGGWLEERELHEDKFILIRYEDMLDSVETEIMKVENFLKLNKSVDKLRRAVELSSFERMRQEERKCAPEDRFLMNTVKDIHFVRSGKKFEWKEKLDPRLQNIIKQKWGYLMGKLRYEL